MLTMITKLIKAFNIQQQSKNSIFPSNWTIQIGDNDDLVEHNSSILLNSLIDGLRNVGTKFVSKTIQVDPLT